MTLTIDKPEIEARLNRFATKRGLSLEDAIEALLDQSETVGYERDWRRVAGALKDDPTFDEWQAIIAENRRIENEAEGIYPERNPEPKRGNQEAE